MEDSGRESTEITLNVALSSYATVPNTPTSPCRVTSMLPPMPVNVMVLEGLMSVKRFLFLKFEADAQ